MKKIPNAAKCAPIFETTTKKHSMETKTGTEDKDHKGAEKNLEDKFETFMKNPKTSSGGGGFLKSKDEAKEKKKGSSSSSTKDGMLTTGGVLLTAAVMLLKAMEKKKK